MGLRFLVTILAAALAPIASAQVPTPTIEGPIGNPGSAFFAGTSFDLAEVGYVSEEYFLSGAASAYTNDGPLGLDGIWSVSPGATAPYKTRIVVHRPLEPRKFNGTVVVEWLNVSGGLDAGPDWTFAHTHITREGWIWVGVSAQKAGIDGGGIGLGLPGLPLKVVDPARYGSLLHPGDSFSYDMYSQAGQAVRSPTGPLGGLTVKRVIALGESQSAFRLVNYVNAIQRITHVYNAYFIHSRGAFGAPLSEAPQPTITPPGGAAIRSDIDVPVLTFETESDLTFLAYAGARQPDAANFRLWEVAGTAHADLYTVLTGMTDRGEDPAAFDLIVTAAPLPGIIECNAPINSGQQHVVVKAALAALERWVRTGKAPPSAPLLELNAGAIVTDVHGNGVGGIRTPSVDVPIATFTGDQGNAASLLCRLFGTTTPFDNAKLASLYPTHQAFVSTYYRALRRSVKAGWILRSDARLMKKWARYSTIGG